VSAPLFILHPHPKLFLLPCYLLVAQDLFFCPFRAFALLPADLFYALSFFRFAAEQHILYFVDKYLPCKETIE